MTVVYNLKDAKTMLKERGLEPNGRVQKVFTHLCKKHMDAYVPFRQGILKNTATVDGGKIIYNQPYARNMYYGVVMVDPVTKAAGFVTSEGWKSRKGVKKIPSDREYIYNQAPKRGKLWDVRMWQDKKHIIIDTVAKEAGGRAK